MQVYILYCSYYIYIYIYIYVVHGILQRRHTLPRDASATLYPSEGCFSDVKGPFRTKDPKTSKQK